jgi:hypothetical protein
MKINKVSRVHESTLAKEINLAIIKNKTRNTEFIIEDVLSNYDIYYDEGSNVKETHLMFRITIVFFFLLLFLLILSMPLKYIFTGSPYYKNSGRMSIFLRNWRKKLAI